MKSIKIGVLALISVASLTACGAVPGLTVEDIPLPAPGGIGDAITLTTTFENALNLPSKAKVRLGGVDVGEVESITAKNYRAVVTMKVSDDTELPVGTGAELRQATPLGDVFVALQPPTTADKGFLRDGDQLGGPTSAAATVEDLLVSMTSLVDSGSVNSLQRIFTELSTAVSGKSTELTGVIEQFTLALSRFNKNSTAVDQAMAATSRLTGEFAQGKNQIAAAINKLGPAVDAVNGQLGLILSTLDKTNKVTAATNDFLGSEQDNLAEMLTHLRETIVALDASAPILGQVSDRLEKLTPLWVRSTPGSAAAVSAKVYWLTPGAGFDSASRLPELGDLQTGGEALQQTLTRLLARLTGTMGCCG